MMESWGPGRTGTPPPGLPPPSGGSNNNGGATSAITPSIIPQPGTTAPIASPEGVSDVSQKSGIWEGANSSSGGVAEGPSRSVSHAASLDAISKRAVKPETARAPCRSLTCSVSAKHSKIFPGVASESDLQKWRTSRDRKSPSLSQMGPDSIKHKFSLQDNGSAKYFQGAMHTPNMGEKVAQHIENSKLTRNIIREHFGRWQEIKSIMTSHVSNIIGLIGIIEIGLKLLCGNDSVKHSLVDNHMKNVTCTNDLLERTHAKARGKERVVRGLEKFMGFPLHGALISVAISPVLTILADSFAIRHSVHSTKEDRTCER
ncbi:hypothetical protein ALC53_12564 [Atta colombica]|uniref:Uncharacterized protein n=1 Tax=Atta colombica TaxID=520822 RepID=A0A195AXP7_9HYME|nr:hypothetical protein ALC53_12564 [Atta colombica]